MVCLEPANNPSLRTGEGSVAERLAFWREAPGELAMWQSWPQLWLVQLEDPALTVAKLPEHCAFYPGFLSTPQPLPRRHSGPGLYSVLSLCVRMLLNPVDFAQWRIPVGESLRLLCLGGNGSLFFFFLPITDVCSPGGKP